MQTFQHREQAVDFLFSQAGKTLRLGTVLGLGKPIPLMNAIYERVRAHSELHLEVYTALSLVPPRAPKNSLEERFLTPFAERHFGKDYPPLLYAEEQRAGRLPPNVRVHEFYFQPAKYLRVEDAQADYISMNYTHAARSLRDRGLNAVVQMIAARTVNGKTTYSLSCNPDLTLDLADLARADGKPLIIVGVVHPALPYLGGDAEVDASFFSAILHEPGPAHELFALPKEAVEPADHLIGLHASRLIRDDGTLQIGIGALSDALVHATIMRHQHNGRYRELIEAAGAHKFADKSDIGAFTKGLYGTSEMIMDGLMHLRRAGILKREVRDLDENKRRYLHGAFFLGSKDFYQWLRWLEGEDFSGLGMTRVSKVNDLYDAHELALRRQRQRAGFFNTAMQISLLGGAVSDTLPDGQVISGVGGQYNFVAMARELEDAFSVLMLRSTRTAKGKRLSNIRFALENETIPRHLRDLVVTEYGIADLRGRSDEETAIALVQIADSEFQEELIKQAQDAGKVRRSFRLPEWAKSNSPARIDTFLEKHRSSFPEYPFGSDFTELELKIVGALKKLKTAGRGEQVRYLARGAFRSEKDEELKRLRLNSPANFREWLYASLVKGAL